MDHKSRIIVSTSDVASYDVFKISETAVALDLKGMRVPERLKRGLDTKAFDSAVEYISLYNVKSEASRDVRIIVRLKEVVNFETTQEDKRIYLDFDKPLKTLVPGQASKTAKPRESRVSVAEAAGSGKEKPESQEAKPEIAEAEGEKGESQLDKQETVPGEKASAEKTQAAEKEGEPKQGSKGGKEVATDAAERGKEQVPPAIVGKKESILETLAAQKRYTGRKLSLDFKDADIKNILRLIAPVMMSRGRLPYASSMFHGIKPWISSCSPTIWAR